MGKFRKQSDREEFFNGLSHGISLLLLSALMPWLYQAALNYREGEYLWTFFVFLFGTIATYSSSAIYHFVRRGVWKDRWRIIDHISIFFLIGGTYTPIIVQYLSDPYRYIFLGIMWTIILIGGILKFWWTGKYDNLSTGIYVFLGWMLLFVIWPIWKNTPGSVFAWIIAGGLAYTIGVFFYKRSNTLYFHVIWHVFVFFGTLCHWMAIFLSFRS